jgi:hypothetical protein
MEQDWHNITRMANAVEKHKYHNRAMQSEELVYVKADTRTMRSYLFEELQKVSSEKSLKLSCRNTQCLGHSIPWPAITWRTGPPNVAPREAPELKQKLWELHGDHRPVPPPTHRGTPTKSALRDPTGKRQPLARRRVDFLPVDSDPGIGPSHTTGK